MRKSCRSGESVDSPEMRFRFMEILTETNGVFTISLRVRFVAFSFHLKNLERIAYAILIRVSSYQCMVFK